MLPPFKKKKGLRHLANRLRRELSVRLQQFHLQGVAHRARDQFPLPGHPSLHHPAFSGWRLRPGCAPKQPQSAGPRKRQPNPERSSVHPPRPPGTPGLQEPTSGTCCPCRLRLAPVQKGARQLQLAGHGLQAGGASERGAA